MVLTVGHDHAGARLDVFLAAMCPEHSRSFLARLVREGHVRVNGQPARPGRRVEPEDEVRVDIPDVRPARVEAEALPLTLLYQDDDIAVVDKPPGMVVHPAAGHAGGTLVNALLHHLDGLSGVGGEARPGIVHRLDRDTSGVMVVCKHDAAHRALSERFKAREVEKDYVALVYGEVPLRGCFDTPYGRHPQDRKRFTARSGARRAVTRYRRAAVYSTGGLAVSRVDVRLETGRTHQIRVHFAEAGHPLVGEQVYARHERWLRRVGDPAARAAIAAFGRQALHARALGFAHPVTGAPVRFEAPLPADMQELIRALDRPATPDP